ncbi:hypothetical protein GCM10009000_035310 [Halobacterium noricense]
MPAGKMKITDSEILEYFQSSQDPCFSAGECSEDWGMSSEGARKRLNELVDRGELESKKPGHRTRIYWLSEADVEA